MDFFLLTLALISWFIASFIFVLGCTIKGKRPTSWPAKLVLLPMHTLLAAEEKTRGLREQIRLKFKGR